MDTLRDICMSENIGWFATALFAVSYMVKKELHLLYVQAFAALIWITYGMAHNTQPVVLANVIVAVSAVIKALRIKAAGRSLA